MKRIDADILTVDDLAELFECDKETAAARLTSGDLPGVKVGRGWIIPRQALFERLNEKARDEAAARRERNTTSGDGAQRINDVARALSQKSKNLRPSVLLPTSTNRRGRKRREPPTLPSIPL